MAYSKMATSTIAVVIDSSVDTFTLKVHFVSMLGEGIHRNVLEVVVDDFYVVLM